MPYYQTHWTESSLPSEKEGQSRKIADALQADADQWSKVLRWKPFPAEVWNKRYEASAYRKYPKTVTS